MTAVDYTQLIARNTILYGESGTGKSTIILDILFHLKQHIPSCIVVSPTESANGTYTGIIPDLMIDSRADLTSAQLKQKLIAILKRQQQITQDYKLANNPDVLLALYNVLLTLNKIPKATADKVNTIRKNIDKCNLKIHDANNDAALTFDANQLLTVVESFEKIIAQCNAKLLKIYRELLNANSRLLLDSNIDQD